MIGLTDTRSLIRLQALYPVLIIFITALKTSTIDSMSLGGITDLSSADLVSSEAGIASLSFATAGTDSENSRWSGSTFLVTDDVGLVEQARA